MKLASAVKAGLPVIACQTRDTVNFPDILHHLTGKLPQPWSPTTTKLTPKAVHYWIMPKGYQALLPLTGMYELCQKAEVSLIIVNPNYLDPVYFDAGEVDIPKDMLFDTLKTVTTDDDVANAVVRALGGCTLKESMELAQLSMSDTQTLTAAGVTDTRKQYFQASRGFTQVDTNQPFYEPAKELHEWLDDEGAYFLTGNDVRLRARGLLLAGPPGTGKTSGAKFIAHKLGVPLFRLDIAGAKNKYVGESENNLIAALTRLDREEPCIVLLDEIEKVFGNQGNVSDGNTTSSLLSQMLWWLQEHTSRVAVIMTTNKEKLITPELIRPGRLDKKIDMPGMVDTDARSFVGRLLKTFPEFKVTPTEADLKEIVKLAMAASPIPDTKPAQVAHADVTGQTFKFVKHKIKIKFKDLGGLFAVNSKKEGDK